MQHFTPPSSAFPSNNSKRIVFIDALRGFTMFLVVYNHIAGKVFFIQDDIGQVCRIFRMPLFFFISGFLAYAIYNRELMQKRFKNRLLYQLLPTIATCLIYTFFTTIARDTDLHSLLHDVYKNGYWFTWVAFQFFAIYMICVGILKITRASKTAETLLFTAILLAAQPLTSLCFRNGVLTSSIGETMSLQFVLQYLPYFFLGLLMKMHLDVFNKIISGKWAMSFALAAFVILYAIGHDNPYLQIAHSILGVLILFRFFQYYQHIFSAGTMTGRVLSTVGKYTLEIYLIHYFIIGSLNPLGAITLFAMAGEHWVLQLILIVPLTVITIAICLLAAKLVNISHPLYVLLLGRPK